MCITVDVASFILIAFSRYDIHIYPLIVCFSLRASSYFISLSLSWHVAAFLFFECLSDLNISDARVRIFIEQGLYGSSEPVLSAVDHHWLAPNSIGVRCCEAHSRQMTHMVEWSGPRRSDALCAHVYMPFFVVCHVVVVITTYWHEDWPTARALLHSDRIGTRLPEV